MASVIGIELDNAISPLLLQYVKLTSFGINVSVGSTSPDILGRLLYIESFVHSEVASISIALLDGHVVILFERQAVIIPQFISFQETSER